QAMAGPETDDPAVLEKAPNDALDPDVIRKTRNTRTQAADAANHQVDPHPGLARLVKAVDEMRIDERIQLGPDRRGTAGERVADLFLDGIDQPPAQVDGRDRDLLKACRLGIAS